MSDYLKEEYYIKLQVPGKDDKFYRIQSIEPFNFWFPETGAAVVFGAIAGSGGASGWIDVDDLEPADDRLFQARVGVEGGCDIYYKIEGKDQWGVDENEDVGYLDVNISPWFEPNPHYEIWLPEDSKPSFNAVNNLPTGITITPRLYFEGMKYDLEEITEAKESNTLSKLKSREISYRTIRVGGTIK